MYGTTIRSYNGNKGSKFRKAKKDKSFFNQTENKKVSKRLKKDEEDTRYMRLNSDSNGKGKKEQDKNDGFSIKELPIASVVVTVILTMMMLVMTSGFGGL